MSGSQGLMNFAIGLVNSVLNLPNRVLWGIQITEELSVINPGHRKFIFRLLEMNFGLVHA